MFNEYLSEFFDDKQNIFNSNGSENNGNACLNMHHDIGGNTSAPEENGRHRSAK